MKAISFFCIVLLGIFLVNCKKDDNPVKTLPVHIYSPVDGAMVHDTVPILFSVSNALSVERIECYVDYQLSNVFDTVPSTLYFYSNLYTRGSTHHYSMTVFTTDGKAFNSNTIAMTISMLMKPRVSVNSTSKSSLTLSWSDNSYDRLGYRVKRKEGNSSFSVIANLTPITNSYTDHTIDTARTYSYLVEVFSSEEMIDSDTLHVAYFLDRYHFLSEYDVPTAADGKVLFSPDGLKIVVTNYWDDNFTVINTLNGSKTSLPETGGTLGLAMSHSGSFFVTGGTHDWDLIKIWDLNTLSLIRQFDSESANYSLLVNNADDQLVVGGEPVRIYNIGDGSVVKTFSVENAYCRAAQFSQDESILLTGGNDNLVKIYNTASGALIRTFTGHTRQVGSTVFSTDELKIISGSYEDRMINFWDVNSGNLLKTITATSETVSICKGKNGDIIIAANNGTITIMDQDGKVKQVFKEFNHLLSADFNDQLDLIAGYGSLTGNGVKIFKKYGHWEVI
ncbi:MAG: hypothetical protein NT040_08365 [Bacteroidetes bacterium]|nr:hypothetical protein [Bacteroidota bacterium]